MTDDYDDDYEEDDEQRTCDICDAPLDDDDILDICENCLTIAGL